MVGKGAGRAGGWASRRASWGEGQVPTVGTSALLFGLDPGLDHGEDALAALGEFGPGEVLGDSTGKLSGARHVGADGFGDYWVARGLKLVKHTLDALPFRVVSIRS